MLSGLTLDLESGFSLYDNTTKVIDHMKNICFLWLKGVVDFYPEIMFLKSLQEFHNCLKIALLFRSSLLFLFVVHTSQSFFRYIIIFMMYARIVVWIFICCRVICGHTNSPNLKGHLMITDLNWDCIFTVQRIQTM